MLRADDNSGHDAVWEARRFLGLSSWGIRGSLVPEGGNIWFDAFPFDSGMYEVILVSDFEQDGSSPYELSAGGRVLSSGVFPYANGGVDCSAPGLVTGFSMGTHFITQGERINLYGESDYDCDDAGSYAIWELLEFVPVGE